MTKVAIKFEKLISLGEIFRHRAISYYCRFCIASTSSLICRWPLAIN